MIPFLAPDAPAPSDQRPCVVISNDRKLRSISRNNFPPEDFIEALAAALHREFDGTQGAVKTVATLTGSNQKTVKNWFDGTNGPSGTSLVLLCRYSDLVLETVLLFAGRHEQLRARKLVDVREKLREMLELMDALD
jgi:hypothetical protein